MTTPSTLEAFAPRRVALLGATGTIGQATLRALRAQGHEVVCFVRDARNNRMGLNLSDPGVVLRKVNLLDPASVAQEGFADETFQAVVSCMASRSGLPRDAWAVDHQAHLNVLQACAKAGVQQFVLLSAICVQKPQLAFQHAKLAFEQALMDSGLTYAIVRPTAFFKSLSGQIGRLQQGKPFWVFGDGRLTACKPIADDDLGEFLAGCLTRPERHNQILPVGGPGPAITPLEQAQMLAELLGTPLRIRRMPVAFMNALIRVMDALGPVIPSLRDKAELARIGRYYGTESMLVIDPVTGQYDESLTPSWGQRTLREHYRQLLQGEISVDLGEHSVF